MLTVHVLFAVLALSTVIIADQSTEIGASSLIFAKTKRGIIKQEHGDAQDHSYHQTTGSAASVPSTLLPKNDNLKTLSYYGKPVAQKAHQTANIYEVHDPVQPQKSSVEHLLPYSNSAASNRQLQPHGNSKYPSVQYEHIFAAPTKYEVANGATKSPRLIGTLQKPKDIIAYSANPTTFSKSEGYGKVPGLKNFDFPSYRSTLAQTSPRAVQSNAPASNVQIPLYKSTYIAPKVADYSSFYVPVNQPSPHATPAFRAYEKVQQTDPYGGAKDAHANGKVASLPIRPSAAARALPDYVHAFESQPLVLGTGLDYQSVPTVGYDFEGGKASPNGALTSGAHFSSPLSSFQGQVVPIQKTSSTPQFPQYKGASVEFYPSAATLSTSPGTYEPLLTQSQLQFGNPKVIRAGQSVNIEPAVAHFAPAEKIRTDVEVINNKKPKLPPPTKDHDADDEEDEGYKSVEKEYGQDSQKDDDYDYHQRQKFKESAAVADFKPSKTFPFRQYDELFGRYSKDTSDKNAEDKPYSKNQDYSSSDNDDDGDYTVSSKYHSEHSSYNPVYGKYEENDEEEEEESKQVESRRKFEGSPDYAYKTKPSNNKYSNKDGQEFSDSFKKQTFMYSKYRS